MVSKKIDCNNIKFKEILGFELGLSREICMNLNQDHDRDNCWSSGMATVVAGMVAGYACVGFGSGDAVDDVGFLGVDDFEMTSWVLGSKRIYVL